VERKSTAASFSTAIFPRGKVLFYFGFFHKIVCKY
jgi:hypothetical protein